MAKNGKSSTHKSDASLTAYTVENAMTSSCEPCYWLQPDSSLRWIEKKEKKRKKGMNNLKLAIGFNSFFLAFTGMILTNLLVLLFWYGDVVSREVRSIEQYLELLVSRGAAGNTDAFAADIRNIGRMVVTRFGAECSVTVKAEEQSSEGRQTGSLDAVVRQVMHTGKSRHDITSIMPPGLFSHPSAFFAVPFMQQNGKTGVIGLSVPQHYFSDQLLAKQKTLLVYSLVNAIILAVIVFFRLSKSVIRPIDRLIQLADTYKGGDEYDVLDRKNSGELGQLSTSVRAMLSRINKDRNILRDNISQLEKVNQDLEESRQEMVRTEKMAATGRLAAGLGHEIGNPLGIVGGYLELLKKEDIPPSEKQDYIRRAESELDRVNVLVRQLVDIGRKTVVEYKEFDVRPLVESVVEMIKHNKASQNFAFSVDCETETTRVLAQPDSLKQVLINCLLNSIDAIREMGEGYNGTVEVMIDNTLRSNKKVLRITITDNGIGLSREQQQAMFDPFFTTKEPGVGTGLGLTVSQSLMEAFGGRMLFESEEGQGSVMRILIPLASGEGV